MTLKEANKQLEELTNDYEYYLQEKEKIMSMVLPKATEIKLDKIDGGKREDRLLLYMEKLDNQKIDETLDYIQARKENLMNWIDRELKILLKYGEIESAIVQLKEVGVVEDKYTGKYRELTWEEISKEVHWSKSFCRNVYRNYKKKRDID